MGYYFRLLNYQSKDPVISWNTPDPDFTLCFERTALVWVPCLALWLLSPIELFHIFHSKCRDVPWSFINSAKLLLNLVLIGLSLASLGRSVVVYFDSSQTVYSVDIWTPVVQVVTFTLALVYLLWNKVRGMQTSGVLFVFWMLLAVAGIAQFRTELKQESQGVLEDSMFNYIIYLMYFPTVVIMFILNFFADKQPLKTNYPKSKNICPEVTASFVSRLFFRWFDSIVWKGFRNPLTPADLWDLRFQDTSSQVVPLFEKQWAKKISQITKTSPEQNGFSKSYGTMKDQRRRSTKPVSILGPIFRTFWKLFLAGGICKISGDLCAFISPQILSLLIQFVAGKEYMWRGFMYAGIMFVASETQTFFYHHNLMTMSVLGLNIRTALISTIYKKALRISNSARKESTVGEVVNLMAVDAQRFIDFSAFCNLLYSSPITIAISMYFLWQILGPSALAGLAVMIVLVPINITIANTVKKLNMRQMKYKDERVKLMNEILSGIKVLKLYAWEPSFEKQILKIRNKEMAVLRKAALLNASTSFVWTCSSFLVSFATFGVYVMSDDSHVLTAEIAFVATSLFNVMKVPVTMFPLAVQVLVQTIVSTKRINKFLNAEELDLTSVSHDESRKEPLIIENGVFSWGTADEDMEVLRNITLKVQPGQLVAVVGAVGSGKSSLISAFLGEMDKISGYINTKGSIAYVPQQAWIQNATVRDNITFSSSYDNKKYKKTVEACALQPDFDMLPGGDMTEIGEKGINLSGGQKQRVSLARAVYSDADTYLLDDPLSAVDSHVGKHIFDNVIGPTGVLNKKTRVLVTHGVTFLPKVDMIVVLKAGEISEVGTFKELLARKGEFADFLVQHITATEESELEPDIEELIEDNPELKIQVQRQLSSSGSVRSRSSVGRRGSVESMGSLSVGRKDSVKARLPVDKLIQIEKTETGSVKLKVYASYLGSFGLFLTLSTIICQILAQVFSVGSNLWLSKWTSDETAVVDGVEDEPIRNYYLEIYAAFGLCQLVATWASSFSLAFGSIYASRGLHISMLYSVLRAPMSFFDTTPTGRIVNRFGKDIDVVDNTLPGNLSSAMNCFILVCGTLVVITYSTPVFAAVIIPISLLYYFVQRFYVTTSRQLKRLESVSRSPIYSHFSETVTGASSIRAYKVERRFMKTSEDRVDINQMCLYPSMVSNRWLGIRLETVGNLLIFFAALFSVLGRDSLDAGIVGLSISYALQITSMLNYAVRMSSEIETNIVSVERIQEYADVPQEAAWRVEPRPQPQWPDKGMVQFEDYRVRYREGLDLVLRGIDFTVNGGEKIGIVGRTGAGKSSLTLCLFRILEAAGGHIYIDGLDISKIGLGDLRSKLTIIPQDPVLFSGTLRMNLDPFEVYSDTEVWGALQLAHLKDFAKSLPAGLSHTISEGGDNLSVGQRQLVCLARALLRKTQVLILDEATAAIDLETDDLIQQTIRKEFQNCTVLTIAHRLNTILDSDRVVVLDKGMIKEFDSPAKLLKSDSSTFYSMAKDAGLV
ncbi:multidrug resistance-associated protein 1-like isoform X2 [Homalodisca vitripennis]|uniref:multidrug resistance-associated protein 1-like isoform X2 n=1 Tax=Homalodisca vitripennis TaxID=197043 RepID=UPI001EEA3E1A|nr:multidrug resistance-associated protein 1-like isoform X2 [Homalodisca vitripennis]